MDVLLVLTYTAICVAIFKIFRLPVNKWTVPTAILGGIVLIGSLIFVMNYNHPYAEMGRQYFVTTPVISTVSGRVIEVPVKGNTLLEAGDILFKIDPAPFRNRVDSLDAQLNMAQADLKRAEELVTKNALAVRERDQAKARVDQLTADIATARYELEQTVVKAPTDGYATQITLRPGMMASNLPLRPLMVFVHKEEHYFTGWFRQNSLLRLREGDFAEVTFDGIPGKIFSAKVRKVFGVLTEGQVSASGELLDISRAPTPGRIPVIIDITDPQFEHYMTILPGGSFGQAAIYSEHVPHVAIIRKILLRMAAWMNYLFPFH